MKTVLISIGVVVSLILSSFALYTVITQKAITETPEVEITGVSEYTQNATWYEPNGTSYNVTAYYLNISINVHMNAVYKTFTFTLDGPNGTFTSKEQIYQNTTVVPFQILLTLTPEPLPRITSISVSGYFGQDETLISIWKNPN
jgi:hypothetical protein